MNVRQHNAAPKPEESAIVAFDDALPESLKRGYVAAYRWLQDRDAARDAVQEAAARALAAKDRFDPAKTFYPWFYRILKNHCLDTLRKRASARTEQMTPKEPQAAEPSAEWALDQSAREQAVTRAIRALPEAHRTLIELRHFQDLSYEEMADVMDVPLGTVMSRLYRARKALRVLLKKDPAFDEK